MSLSIFSVDVLQQCIHFKVSDKIILNIIYLYFITCNSGIVYYIQRVYSAMKCQYKTMNGGQVYDEGRWTVETRYVLQHNKDRSTSEKKMKKKCVPYALNRQSGIIQRILCTVRKKKKKMQCARRSESNYYAMRTAKYIPRIRN